MWTTPKNSKQLQHAPCGFRISPVARLPFVRCPVRGSRVTSSGPVRLNASLTKSNMLWARLGVQLSSGGLLLISSWFFADNLTSFWSFGASGPPLPATLPLELPVPYAEEEAPGTALVAANGDNSEHPPTGHPPSQALEAMAVQPQSMLLSPYEMALQIATLLFLVIYTIVAKAWRREEAPQQADLTEHRGISCNPRQTTGSPPRTMAEARLRAAALARATESPAASPVLQQSPSHPSQATAHAAPLLSSPPRPSQTTPLSRTSMPSSARSRHRLRSGHATPRCSTTALDTSLRNRSR